MSFFDLSAKRLDGQPQDLSQYRGQVALVVNTASQCGSTPQYDGLEKLYEQHKGQGFVVLGFPSNDFGGQEPGTAAEIASFCETRYSVKFPLFEKVKTKGDGQSPVFTWLAKDGGEPKWNFYKYLVARDGRVIEAYSSMTTPDDRDLVRDVEKALAQ